MGPVEALQLALSKEKEAMERYREFATQHRVARDVFLFLADEEHKHKEMIEKKIYELTK